MSNNREEEIRRLTYSFGSEEDASGMLRITGTKPKERSREVRHQLTSELTQPWAGSANTRANASAVRLRSWPLAIR